MYTYGFAYVNKLGHQSIHCFTVFATP